MNPTLHQISAHCYVVDMPAKAGIVLSDDQSVILIDTGNDVSAAKKIKKILDENQWTLKAIYNTHSNADHIGGNVWLQKQTGCQIYAPDLEACFTRHPIMEPSFLYGGYPFKDLRHKFLMAKPSDAQPIQPADLPKDLNILNLNGHFLEMVGFAYPKEHVVFLADCLSSKETLEKYRISFIYDVKAYLETLEALKSLSGDVFVPAHTPVLYSKEELDDLIEANIENTRQVASDLLGILDTPKTFDEILQALFYQYGLKLSAEQYVLCGSTIRSFLSWLKDQDLVEFDLSDNLFTWKRKKKQSPDESR